jgi:hypothetical protein
MASTAVVFKSCWTGEGVSIMSYALTNVALLCASLVPSRNEQSDSTHAPARIRL